MKRSSAHPLALLLAALALHACSAPAHAQEIQMVVEPVLGGWARTNCWTPVAVRLTNTGPTTEVELRGDDVGFGGSFHRTEYRLPAQLPGPSRRRYQLYVRAHPWAVAGQRPIRLFRNDREILNRMVSVQPMSEGDALVVMISPERGGLSSIADQPRGDTGTGPQGRVIRTGYTTPEDAPDRWAGYDGVDLLVLGDVTEESLSAAQRRAILLWVQTGGTLAVNGGDPARLRSAFFQSLRPTGPGAVDALVSRDGRAGEGQLYFRADDFARANALVSEGGRVGAGQVFFLTADLAREPHRGDPATAVLLRGLLHEARRNRDAVTLPRVTMDAMGSPFPITPLGEVCHQIAQLDAPPVGAIGLFLLAYLVCLVPLNYAILKRRDRKEWAWVTTPAIVLVFSLLAYGVGLGIKGSHLVVARPGILEARAGSTVAAAESYLGLFSPRKTRYDLAVTSREVALSQWNPWAERGVAFRLFQEETWRVANLDVSMWSMRVVRADLPVELGGGVLAQWRRTSRADRLLEGSVTNRTPWDLEGCRVLHNGQSIALGRLARGASFALESVPVGSVGSRWDAIAREVRGDGSTARMQRALLESLAAPRTTAPLLIGWVRAPLFGLAINGRSVREENLHLLVVHL